MTIGNPSDGNSTGSSSSHWTFLTNHSHVLICLSRDPDRVLREVAEEIGITERSVQKIVQDLVEAGIVEKTKVGRRNHYRIRGNRHLRHPVEGHCRVADLIAMANPPARALD